MGNRQEGEWGPAHASIPSLGRPDVSSSAAWVMPALSAPWGVRKAGAAAGPKGSVLRKVPTSHLPRLFASLGDGPETSRAAAVHLGMASTCASARRRSRPVETGPCDSARALRRSGGEPRTLHTIVVDGTLTLDRWEWLIGTTPLIPSVSPPLARETDATVLGPGLNRAGFEAVIGVDGDFGRPQRSHSNLAAVIREVQHARAVSRHAAQRLGLPHFLGSAVPIKVGDWAHRRDEIGVWRLGEHRRELTFSIELDVRDACTSVLGSESACTRCGRGLVQVFRGVHRVGPTCGARTSGAEEEDER